MSPRDTTTGSAYESIVEQCVKRSCEKYSLEAKSQQTIGAKPGGGNHRIDYELISKSDPNLRGLLSCKIQNTSGTAEEKIAYEVIKLLHAMKVDTRYKHAWIVMGGSGWSNGIRKFVNEELVNWIPEMRNKVTILTTDELITRELSLK